MYYINHYISNHGNIIRNTKDSLTFHLSTTTSLYIFAFVWLRILGIIPQQKKNKVT